MEILTVERKRFNAYHTETILKDSNGKIKAIINKMLQQPRKGKKNIIINSVKYTLDWSKI